MTTTTRSQESGTPEYRIIGTRPLRHDALDKVTGAAKYGSDINMPGMLHGKILRSPHAHARIRSIDTSKAEALDGVMAVATSQDLPVIQQGPIDYGNASGNIRMIARNVLACEKALYKGHAIAAVAATSASLAQQAVELIEVDYEVLPPVLSIDDALKPDAPLLVSMGRI